MTAQVWKFPLGGPGIGSSGVLDMPAGAEALSFAVQGPSERPMLWVLIDPEAPKHERRYLILCTGETADVSTYEYDRDEKTDD